MKKPSKTQLMTLPQNLLSLHSLSVSVMCICLLSFRKKYLLQGWVLWGGIPLNLNDKELVGRGREGNELVLKDESIFES